MKLLQQGFTVIELIIVIAIIGILSVFVTPRWLGTGMNFNYDVNRLISTVRYAQSLAINTGKRYQWVKTGTNTYQITDSNNNPITQADGSTTLILASPSTFSSLSNLPNNLVSFDAQGIPYTSNNGSSPLSGQASINLQSGTQTRTVTIYPNTGYCA